MFIILKTAYFQLCEFSTNLRISTAGKHKRIIRGWLEITLTVPSIYVVYFNRLKLGFFFTQIQMPIKKFFNDKKAPFQKLSQWKNKVKI